MSGLSVRLFGALTIERESGCSEVLCGAKARELLCYLLLHRDRPIARTTLAELLWSGQDDAHGLKHLRQSLWQLHSFPGLDVGPARFEITARSVMLRSEAISWLDVAAFEAAFDAIRGGASHALRPEHAEIADAAVVLYRGDLLEGVDYDWCIVEREYLRSAYLTMLDRLMLTCERTSEYELGIEYGERILRVDRAREYTHRRMMYLHALLGNRTGALRQFDRCAHALIEELDVAPARTTIQLCDLIRTGAELPARTPHHSTDLLPGPVDRELAPLERLNGIQRALIELQSQIKAGTIS